MGEISTIEWTDATWNPWHGCRKVSLGCKNCYMFRDKKRYGQDPNVVVRSKDATFYAPLKWKEPRKIFTCSWSDFFIEESDEWRDEAFAIMALTPQHTYQILTKRPERMLKYFKYRHVARDHNRADFIADQIAVRLGRKGAKGSERTAGTNFQWPLPNVLLGVSVEDQKTADERIPLLLQTPAAVRFLSMEPLLGTVDVRQYLRHTDMVRELGSNGKIVPEHHEGIGWTICGGESGPDARPMHPDWVRSIRDQCVAAGVPFHFKQYGEWSPYIPENRTAGLFLDALGRASEDMFKVGIDTGIEMHRVGKKKAGRILDGRTWDEFPEVKNDVQK